MAGDKGSRKRTKKRTKKGKGGAGGAGGINAKVGVRGRAMVRAKVRTRK